MNTVRDALVEASRLLSAMETPFLDATLLLAHTLGVSKEKILASYPEELPLSAQNEFRGYLKKRLEGCPVSYIRHKKEFLGLPFYVDNRVLVPRPETETLVELVMEHADTLGAVNSGDTGGTGRPSLKVLDLGTGSGCIAISLKYLRPALQVTASDASAAALKVCGMNALHLLSEPLPMNESDLFSGIDKKFDVIVSNPPYLTDSEVAEMERNHWPEPRMALAGGDDGLDIIRILIREAPENLEDGGTLFMEAHINQIETIRTLMLAHGYTNVRAYRDLTGRDRVVSGKKPYAESH
ncbi:MAG: peptide chain release factor N(5)-glutamine methyltransferase [Spirochaetota bacterium]|nr:peptide chain release factor N(5)-glutamine methyltransferase [Spirochaetota bacterium]